jgi:hypothetical protein
MGLRFLAAKCGSIDDRLMAEPFIIARGHTIGVNMGMGQM